MDKKNVYGWIINLTALCFLVLSAIGFKYHKDGVGCVGLILGMFVINTEIENVMGMSKKIKEKTFKEKIKLALNILSISSLSVSFLVYVLATDFGIGDVQAYDTLASKIFVYGFLIAFFVEVIRGIFFKVKLFVIK